MRNRFAAALLALALATAPTLADVITTNTGVRIEGTIVSESRREVTIRSRRGNVIKVPRSDIERISREDPAEAFGKRFEKASLDEDLDALLDLAKWARANKLHGEARRANERVLELNSDQPTARRRLGYQKVEGAWLRDDELHEALGHVRYEGAWVTAEDYDRVIAGFAKDADGNWVIPQDDDAPRRERTVRAPAEPARAEPASADRRPALPAEAGDLLKVVKGAGSDERKQAALAALADLGPDAVAALQEALEEQLAKARKKLADHFDRNKSKIRARLAREIVARRQEALACITDTTRYPDANHGAAGQPEVDRLVDRLRRAYQDPLGETLETSEDAAELLADVERVAGNLNEYCGSDHDAGAMKRALSDDVREAIDMRRFPVSGADAQILRASEQILAYNASVTTTLTDEERACVDATNDYRIMFGIKALKVFEPLVQAARKHSTEMVQLKYFDHTSPTPGNRSPSQRCQREGASFSGENIAMGMTTGKSAFHAWYTSSGHHRNMLARHNSIGIGQHQNHWTQNFGADNPK